MTTRQHIFGMGFIRVADSTMSWFSSSYWLVHPWALESLHCVKRHTITEFIYLSMFIHGSANERFRRSSFLQIFQALFSLSGVCDSLAVRDYVVNMQHFFVELSIAFSAEKQMIPTFKLILNLPVVVWIRNVKAKTCLVGLSMLSTHEVVPSFRIELSSLKIHVSLWQASIWFFSEGTT